MRIPYILVPAADDNLIVILEKAGLPVRRNTTRDRRCYVVTGRHQRFQVDIERLVAHVRRMEPHANITVTPRARLLLAFPDLVDRLPHPDCDRPHARRDDPDCSAAGVLLERIDYAKVYNAITRRRKFNEEAKKRMCQCAACAACGCRAHPDSDPARCSD